MAADSDGWHRRGNPDDNGDCRKLVTIEDKGGMIWVGIRAWTGADWMNNGMRETDKILAWRELPQPAYSDGLMRPMPLPSLGNHRA